ncbi:MAG TPA: hypothetical protein ENO21_00020 [Firmicutes bacterium]|nr:hypothetical protein [Bacillota bacterium]
MTRLAAAIALFTLGLLLIHPAAAEDVFGARYPALSPDGRTVAFEYWGDIWSAPVDGSAPARRLTDHLAFDEKPRFSPDGSAIAFVSGRSGNADIWIIPAEGGVARRVTTFSGHDNLLGWTTDGTGIIFASDRHQWASALYVIDAHGYDPAHQLTSDDHYSIADAAMLPDGGIVYSRGSDRWWRKGYRGTSQLDLWRLSPEGTNERLTEFNGRDAWPMAGADGKSVYFVSDRDGIDNIWALELDSGACSQVTRHPDDGVQFPAIAPGGTMLAYEYDGGIYTVEPGRSPRRLAITVAAEGKDNWVEKRSFDNQASEFAVSPHGKYAVVEVEGDLWAVKDPDEYKEDEKPDQDLAQAWRLTASDGARERNPAFSPDNRHVAYACDADGDYEIYILDLADNSTRQLTNNSTDDLNPRFDPSDENVLYYNSGNRSIVRHNLESDVRDVVAEGRFRQAFSNLDWEVSPDGRWLAYVDELDDWSYEIFIVPTDGSADPVDITRNPGNEREPRWSADGSRLVYSADRDRESGIYVIDLDPEPATYDLQFLFADDQPEADEEETEAGDADGEDDGQNGEDEDSDEDDGDDDDEGEDEEAGKDEDKDNGKDGSVVIDFEDIHLRARRVSTQDNAGEPVISTDGKWVIYETDPDGKGREVWAVKAEGGSERKLADGSFWGYNFAAKGKRLFYLDGGTVRYMKFSDGSNKGIETYSARGEYWLDKRARWHQMYREGWRTLGERFYDKDMHGADWDAVYEKYLPYVDHLGTPEEFELMFSELLGELNASHLSIRMRDSSYSTGGASTGHLGLEFDQDFPGPGLKVSHVTYLGPADQPGVEIGEGDIVLEIAGTPVSADMRWLDLLDDMGGKPVPLTVADGGGARQEVIKATSYGGYQGLLYREWEIANEQKVGELSGGRIGYIHIAGMNRREWSKFEREFYSELFDKDAIVIDVRFNGGGWLHEDLFEALDRNVFGMAGPRGAERVVQPPGAYKKPKALLINARSYSDAEIFPAGWRALGLGPIVGIDTGGAVIGTTGFTLIDGSWVRLPVEGWWELDGRNLETSGTAPDYYVDVHPDELKAGFDAQLAKAVELLLAELQ